VLIFTALGLRSVRFIGNLVLLGVLVAMENQGAEPGRREWGWRERLSHGVVAVLLLGMLWSICTDRFFNWQAELKRFGSGHLTSEMPVAASSFLEINDLGGNLLSTWSDADYLIWHNGSRVKVAEDGRTAPFPRALSSRLRAIFEGDPAALAAFEADYPVDGAVLAWHRLKLARVLSTRTDWKLVFIGPYATVWMRRESLAAQGDAGMESVSPERFLVLDPVTAYHEESWLAYPAFLHRRVLVFAAIGRHDLARSTALAWQAYDPSDPVLAGLAEPLGIVPPPRPGGRSSEGPSR
jgi:hypothetical protein